MELQLCKTADRLPKGGDWIFEMKYDGYRAAAVVDDKGVRLKSRNGNEFLAFKHLAQQIFLWAKGQTMVLDGEIVVVDKNGKTDFSALQAFAKNGGNANLIFVAFDLLSLNGKDFCNHTLVERKQSLRQLLADAPSCLHFSPFVEGVGEAELSSLCERGFEGVVAKKKSSLYSGTRNGDWLKIKCRKTDDFLIGGFAIDETKKQLSSVLVGKPAGSQLVFWGKVGTGFSESQKTSLVTEFQKILTQNSPFENPPKQKNSAERLFWVLPQIEARVQFAELTKSNLLRQASFLGIKKSVLPKTETKAQNIDTFFGVKLTSPERLVFKNPDVKKVEVARHYQLVSSRMLPHLKDRALSLVCCPKGVEAEQCFFKKHIDAEQHGLSKFSFSDKEGFFVSNQSGIIFLVQMNTIEFHTWGSSVKSLDKPDIAVLDLDPDEGLPIENVRQGTKNVKALIDKLNLKSFLKTSGGKGFHIVVPFANSKGWDDFKQFCKSIASAAERVWPKMFTSNQKKENRKGKIFVDWMRNGKGATSVAPYSLRAKGGAKVSMPIFWDELDSLSPDSFCIFDVEKRLNLPDPWADFFEVKGNQKFNF